MKRSLSPISPQFFDARMSPFFILSPAAFGGLGIRKEEDLTYQATVHQSADL